MEQLIGVAHAHRRKGHLPIVSMGICRLGDGQKSGHLPTMIDDRARRRLADEIAAQGREMKELSLAAGLGETYVRDVIHRGRGKLENLIKVTRLLGKPDNWLVGSGSGPDVNPQDRSYMPSNTAMNSKLQHHPRAGMPETNARGIEPGPSYGDPLPVIGASRGGADGKLVYNGQPIEFIPRPPVLVNVEDAYATYVVGESMLPRFRPGEKVWVHPHRPAREGDDVVVQLYPEEEGEAPEGYIKEFCRFTPTSVVLTQHNPREEIVLDRRKVKSVHVIVGSLFI